MIGSDRYTVILCTAHGWGLCGDTISALLLVSRQLTWMNLFLSGGQHDLLYFFSPLTFREHMRQCLWMSVSDQWFAVEQKKKMFSTDGGRSSEWNTKFGCVCGHGHDEWSESTQNRIYFLSHCVQTQFKTNLFFSRKLLLVFSFQEELQFFEYWIDRSEQRHLLST